MKFKELREKQVHELHQLLAASRDALRMLKFKVASQELKDVREIRETRVMIAQILSLLSSKNQ